MKPLVKTNFCLGYEDLVASMEFDALIAWHDQRDYQGDTWVLARRGGRFAFLNFSWGSCSGCDALEAAGGSIKELTELRNRLYGQIRWFETEAELWNWVDDDSFHPTQAYFHRSDFRTFLTEVRDALGSRPDEEAEAVASIQAAIQTTKETNGRA
jgi:hypothetical protein